MAQWPIPASPATPPLINPPRPAMPTLRPDAGELRTLVVGRGITVQGMVQNAERLVVVGTVEAGMLRANQLSISPGGLFRGEVEADEAEIAGTIDGTLTAWNSLIIRASGRLSFK